MGLRRMGRVDGRDDCDEGWVAGIGRARIVCFGIAMALTMAKVSQVAFGISIRVFDGSLDIHQIRSSPLV